MRKVACRERRRHALRWREYSSRLSTTPLLMSKGACSLTHTIHYPLLPTPKPLFLPLGHLYTINLSPLQGAPMAQTSHTLHTVPLYLV